MNGTPTSTAGARPTQNSPATHGVAGDEDAPQSLGASLLILGLLATAVVGAPFQIVLPDTIKSIVAALFALAALAVLTWQLGTKNAQLRWSLFLLAPFGLALMALVSATWAPATSAVTESVRWLLVGTIAAVALNTLGAASFAWIARAAHAAAVFVSVLALMQFWFDFSWFPASSPPGANFGNRNTYAEFVASSLPFSLWLLFRQTALKRTLVCAVGVGLILVGLMSTGARAALLAAIAGTVLSLAFVLVYRLRSGTLASAAKSSFVAIAVPLAIVAALGAIPTTNPLVFAEHTESGRGLTPFDRASTRLQSLLRDETYRDEASFGIRRAAWNAGVKMIAANPIRGVGAGGWNSAAPLYLPETIDTEHVWMAHNETLQLVAEYGLVGWAALLALAALLAWVLAGVARSLQRQENQQAAFQNWTAALSIGLFGIAGMSGLNLHTATTVYLLALSIGYLLFAMPTRRMALPEGLPAPALWAARGVACASIAVAVVIAIQGFRSDLHVQRGGGMIATLAQSKTPLPKETANQLRTQAVEELRRGLAIYSDHGTVVIELADALAKLEDPANVLWLSNMMLATRPNVVGLKCNLVRANADLGNFLLAEEALKSIKASRPNAACLPLSEFVYTYKAGRFAEAVPVGQKLIQDFKPDTSPAVARYVVDTTYRAAIRVPAVDAAIDVLRVRAERWPELRSSSWFLMGQLMASRSPTQVAADAVEAFKRALAEATPQEKAAVAARIPEAYRARLN